MPPTKKVLKNPFPAESLGGGDFYSELLLRVSDKQEAENIAGAILQGVKNGEPAALKILDKVLEESRYQREEVLKLTDDQYRNIILLAAHRILKDFGLSPADSPAPAA